MAVQDGFGKTSGSESLVFAYDLKDTTNSYRGEPTTNLVATIASYYGGNVSTSYANGQYQTSAIVINGVDNTIPSGNFSQVSGTTTDTNSQTYWTIQGNAVVNESNQTVSFSVYLKGSGTCHLATYNDQCCYQLGPDITLTSDWTRYTITKSLTTFVDYHWVAVRGITTSTNVFISSAQWERNSHSTPFTTTSRSNTQGLLDLTTNSTVNISGVSFNSSAVMTFDGTNDEIVIPYNSSFNTNTFTVESVCKLTTNDNQHRTVASRNASVYSHSNGWWMGTLRNGLGNGNNDFRFFLWGDSGYITYNTSNGGNDNLYHHMVLSCDGTTGFFYIDGVLVYSETKPSGNLYSSSSDLLIGKSPSGDYWSGDIPQVKLYNRALTSTEITNNYLKYKRQYGLT
jgi:hypothetical protein